MKIVIDGNIGSGKSSTISLIQEKTRLPIFLEPITEWTEYLEAFYQDPNKYALAFNLKVLSSFERWKNNNFKAIYERSPESCKYIFHKSHYEDGIINNIENNIFDELYYKLSWKPDILIYIDTPPAVCYQRMQQRNRNAEKNVPLQYLEKLDYKYNEYIKMLPHVHRIDGTLSNEEISNIIIKIIKDL